MADFEGFQTRPFVQTVLGPVEPERLGITLMHEHLIWDFSAAVGKADRVEGVWPLERVLDRLGRAYGSGVRGLVDVTPEQLGPHPLVYRLIALESSVHIVCATGYYAVETTPGQGGPGGLYPPDADRIADELVASATLGIERSGVKPGIFKLSTSGKAVFDVEEAALQGAAAAQQRTGLAITTHTQATRFAREQVEILLEAGASPDRVVIGHIGWGSGPEDFELHESLARTGVNLGLDLIGTPIRSDAEWARIALDLIEAGYESQLVLSHDNCGWARGFEIYDSSVEPGFYSGDFTTVTERVVPLLIDAGVSERTVQRILVDNPRRILAVDPGRYPQALETVLWQPDQASVLLAGDAGPLMESEV